MLHTRTARWTLRSILPLAALAVSAATVSAAVPYETEFGRADEVYGGSETSTLQIQSNVRLDLAPEATIRQIRFVVPAPNSK
jgi:hypothetical protein